MGELTSVVLSLLLMAVFLYLLFFVVRLAVKEGVQQALRTDLLDPRALQHADDAPVDQQQP